MQLPGRLWGKVLRSPYPYARIRHIDTRRARELPGVHAVITGQDIPPTLVGRRLRDVPVLARDVVRFVGDRVAAVAAEDRGVAEAALGLIEVDYDELRLCSTRWKPSNPRRRSCTRTCSATSTCSRIFQTACPRTCTPTWSASAATSRPASRRPM